MKLFKTLIILILSFIIYFLYEVFNIDFPKQEINPIKNKVIKVNKKSIVKKNKIIKNKKEKKEVPEEDPKIREEESLCERAGIYTTKKDCGSIVSTCLSSNPPEDEESSEKYLSDEVFDCVYRFANDLESDSEKDYLEALEDTIVEIDYTRDDLLGEGNLSFEEVCDTLRINEDLCTSNSFEECKNNVLELEFEDADIDYFYEMQECLNPQDSEEIDFDDFED